MLGILLVTATMATTVPGTRVPVPSALQQYIRPARRVSFEPYTDVMLYPTPDLSAILRDTRADRIRLGFIVSDGNGKPAWAGTQPIAWTPLLRQIEELGPDRFVVSFGGAAGQELANANANRDGVTSPQTLADLYLSVVKTTKIVNLDFDVEGSAVSDSKANRVRALALALVQKAVPSVQISFTLPVMQTGLDEDALRLVKGLVSVPNLVISLVNIMTMDFGTGERQMGKATVLAAQVVRDQLDALDVRATRIGLGLTPMIGQNDTGEIFTLKDAGLVGKSLSKLSTVRMLGFWSTARDNNIQTSNDDLDTHSRVEQDPWAFSNIFADAIKPVRGAGSRGD